MVERFLFDRIQRSRCDLAVIKRIEHTVSIFTNPAFTSVLIGDYAAVRAQFTLHSTVTCRAVILGFVELLCSACATHNGSPGISQCHRVHPDQSLPSDRQSLTALRPYQCLQDPARAVQAYLLCGLLPRTCQDPVFACR